MSKIHYEDIEVGEAFELGEWEATEEEMVEYAKKYDPRNFHVDPETAKDTVHGGIIASGFYTLSVANRLVVDQFRSQTTAIAGIAIEDLQWHEPVRPGDRLSATLEITEKRTSNSMPENGIVNTRIEVFNQNNDLVLSFVDIDLFQRKGDE